MLSTVENPLMVVVNKDFDRQLTWKLTVRRSALTGQPDLHVGDCSFAVGAVTVCSAGRW